MRYLIIPFLCFFCFACRPTPTKKKEDGSPATPTTDRGIEPKTDEDESDAALRHTGEEVVEYNEMTKPKRVRCWVDGLIMKQFPGNDMPKVGTMRLDEEAGYLYQRTARLSEYVFRGQKFTDAWYLVQNKAGIMGWVHGGGLKFVETSPEVIRGNEGQTDANARKAENGNLPTENDWVFLPGKRIGSISRNTSEEKLVSLFGPNNLKRGKVVTIGAATEACTYIYKDTPDEIALTWKDDTRTKVKAVYMGTFGGKWHSPSGIKIGMSLGDLAKLNEAAILFYGFAGEYSGTISDWKKGKISPATKGFYLVLHYDENKSSKEFLAQVKQEKTFNSNAEPFRHVEVYIKRIVVYLDIREKIAHFEGKLDRIYKINKISTQMITVSSEQLFLIFQFSIFNFQFLNYAHNFLYFYLYAHKVTAYTHFCLDILFVLRLSLYGSRLYLRMYKWLYLSYL